MLNCNYPPTPQNTSNDWLKLKWESCAENSQLKKNLPLRRRSIEKSCTLNLVLQSCAFQLRQVFYCPLQPMTNSLVSYNASLTLATLNSSFGSLFSIFAPNPHTLHTRSHVLSALKIAVMDKNVPHKILILIPTSPFHTLFWYQNSSPAKNSPHKIRMFRIKFSFLKTLSKNISFLAVFVTFLRLVSQFPIKHCAKLAIIGLSKSSNHKDSEFATGKILHFVAG